MKIPCVLFAIEKNSQSIIHFEVVMHLQMCGAESTSPIQKWSSNENEFFIVWKLMVQKLKQKELEKVAVIMRNIWLRRNMVIF